MEYGQVAFDKTSEGVNMPKLSASKLIYVVLFPVVILLGGFLWKWATTPDYVTVTGSGTVTVPATSAQLNITISTVGANAQTAVSDAIAKSTAIKGVLTSNNVPAGEISTSQVQVTPAGALVSGATGYQAAIALTAKTAYVSGLEVLIVNLYQAGATVVGQPVVAVENQQSLEATAVAKAMQNAEANLAMLPVVKWHPIRKVVTVSQASSGSTSTSTKQVAAGAPDSAAATNGTFEVTQAVSVTYALW